MSEWFYKEDNRTAYVYDSTQKLMFTCTPLEARIICKSVNCHRDFVDFAENFILWHPESKNVIEKLNKLLKRARGES